MNQIVMCKTCARAIEYTGDDVPETHDECPTVYLE